MFLRETGKMRILESREFVPGGLLAVSVGVFPVTPNAGLLRIAGVWRWLFQYRGAAVPVVRVAGWYVPTCAFPRSTLSLIHI